MANYCDYEIHVRGSKKAALLVYAPYAAPETKDRGGDARKGDKKEASPIRKHP